MKDGGSLNVWWLWHKLRRMLWKAAALLSHKPYPDQEDGGHPPGHVCCAVVLTQASPHHSFTSSPSEDIGLTKR